MTFDQNEKLIAKVKTHFRDLDHLLQFAKSGPDRFVDSSLSNGFPSLICLYSELHHFYPDEGWDKINQQCISKLWVSINQQGVHGKGIFDGIAGVCFSLFLTKECPGLLSLLHTPLLKHIDQGYLQKLKEEPRCILNPEMNDAVSGISGLIPYLLFYSEDERFSDITNRLLSWLIKLSKSGWLIPNDFSSTEERKKSFPNGYYDTGLAHGISGCLAALCFARLKGISVEGIDEAIHKISSWLKSVCADSYEWVPLIDPVQKAKENSQSHRKAWCYGSLGILSALSLAARALKDDLLMDFASEGFIHLENLPFSSFQLADSAFCHGYAGLLTISKNHDLTLGRKNSILTERALAEIAKRYSPNLPFGFESEFYVDKEEMINNLSIVNGSVGTLLSLLYYQSSTKREWTKLFLIG